MFNGFYIIFQIPYIYNRPIRFSHIKRNVTSCRLANHFLGKDYDLVRDKKNQKEFDLSLVKHRRIKVIDIIYIDQSLSTKEK